MNLIIQFKSIIFSFCYGFVLHMLYNIFYKYLNLCKKRYKCLNNLLFFINSSLIYFVLIKLINNGVIHIYFLISLLLGYLLFDFINNKKIK